MRPALFLRKVSGQEILTSLSPSIAIERRCPGHIRGLQPDAVKVRHLFACGLPVLPSRSTAITP
jgi:hypothetical protein